MIGDSLLACPSFADYRGGAAPIVCVQTSAFAIPASSYSISTLPPGRGPLPGLHDDLRVLHEHGGRSGKSHLRWNHQIEPGCRLSQTRRWIADRNRHGDRSAERFRRLCRGRWMSGQDANREICSSPQYSLESQNGGTYQLTLGAGSWRLAAFYNLRGTAVSSSELRPRSASRPGKPSLAISRCATSRRRPSSKSGREGRAYRCGHQ